MSFAFLLPHFVVRCEIWYYLYNLKNMKNTYGGVLILVKLQAEACDFTKINTPPWVFFKFFKSYKWYKIAQRTTFCFDVWNSFEHVLRYFIIDNIIFQRVDVYVNEPIEVDELIKLANQPN